MTEPIPATSKPSGSRRPDFRVNEIDFLRFFAAMMVVLFHYSFRGHAADAMSPMPYPILAPFSKYGYLGVELFFLISGFVILMTASSGSLRRFVISRFVRLYPAYWVACTLTFLAILAFGGERFSATLGQYLLNMTLFNEFLWVPSIDAVYWSLAVEMKFYALIAALLVFRQISRAEIFLYAWLVLTIALTIYPKWILRYVFVADYAAYFIAGATCFLIYSHGLSRLRAGLVFFSWILAMRDCALSAEGMEKKFNTSFDPWVICALVTAFFIVMILVSLRKTGYLARGNWVTVGALTYPLYLVHQNIGYMIFNHGYPGIDPHLLLWGTVAAMLCLAYLINTQVERRYSPRLKKALEAFVSSVRVRWVALKAQK